MLKKEFLEVPIIISLLFAWFAWILLNSVIVYGVYIHWFGDAIVYFRNDDILIASCFFISLTFVFVLLVRIKNYKITKWILFSGIIILLCLLWLIYDEIIDEQFVFVIMYGCIILACLTMLVIMFVVKNHLWTKIVLLFINFCFIASQIIWVVFIVNSEERAEQGWKNERIIKIDKYDFRRKVYLQSKGGEERKVVTEKIMPCVYEYYLYDEDDDIYNWVSPEDYFLGNPDAIEVDSYENLLQEIKEGQHTTLQIKDDIKVFDEVFLENKQDISFIGFIEDGKNISSISAAKVLLLNNCNNISFENLKIDSPVRFENCKSIKFKNCNFYNNTETHLYFDDSCSDIFIEDCEFYDYTDYAINLPFNNIQVSSNDYFLYGRNGKTRDYDFNLNIRHKIELYNLNYFYKKFLLNFAYNFNNKNEHQYSEECVLGIFNDQITSEGPSWVLESFIKKDKQELEELDELNFSGVLKMLSGGISPVLHQPVNKEFYNNKAPVFKYINPKYLSWWHENMIPFLTENENVFSFDFQMLYNNSFRYQMHAFIESYLYLNQKFDLKREAKWYMKASESDWEFVDKLRAKYMFTPLSLNFEDEAGFSMPENLEYLNSELGKVVGFWIRRYIDGTDKQIFKIAMDVAKYYDPEFYNWVQNKDYIYTLERGDIINMKQFIKPFLSDQDFNFLNKALEEYPLILKDTTLIEFYLNKMDVVIESIQMGMFKYREEKGSVEDGDLANIWCEMVCDCMPFVIIDFENTIDGACAYKNIDVFIEKAKTTEGEADDLFFDAEYACFGGYRSAYITTLNEYDGGGYSHSKLGDGNHLKILKKIILAYSNNKKYVASIKNLVDVVLSLEYQNFFGNSKEEVYKELNAIIKLQESTKLDFSDAIKLKSRLDTATVSVHYNCESGDCEKYFFE